MADTVDPENRRITFEDGEVWTESKLERQMAWTACAEEVKQLRGFIFKVNQKAAEAFIANDMAMAYAFRGFADNLKPDLAAAEHKLRQFIAENLG